MNEVWGGAGRTKFDAAMSDDPTPDELQQYNQTWDDMRGGNPFDATQHNPNKAGFGPQAFSAGVKNIAPSPFDHNQGTPTEGQIVPPEDDGSWDNQGDDYGAEEDERGEIVPPTDPGVTGAQIPSVNKETGAYSSKHGKDWYTPPPPVKKKSFDAMSHAWDYLLKGL
jgi:hypothetical protein